MTPFGRRLMVPALVMRNLHLLGCLVLSGFAGLAYELLWVRLLALGFGSTTLSFSTVLGVFFGGLALGAWWGGRKAASLRRPVRAYAAIEAATGLLAIVLYPLIAKVGWVFALIDPGAGILGGLVRALVAMPLLLAPTVLMGASLPFVTKAVVVRNEDVGSGSALIYGFNTLGAFLGTYLVTYHILPGLGVFASTIAVAIVNFAVAGWALAFEQREVSQDIPDSGAEHEVEGGEKVADKIRQTVLSLAFLTGFAAICFQVVWVRLFSIFLNGTIYGVGSVLIAVLVGIGLGSLLIARPLRESREPGLWFAGLQVITLLAIAALSAGLPWVAYTLRSIRESGTSLFSLHLELLGVFIVLLIPSLASGASFPLLMSIAERRASRASRSLGGLYAANTIGSIAGSVLTGFVLIPLTGTVATLFVGVVVVGLVGSVGAALLSDAKPLPRMAVAIAPLALVAAWPGFDVQRVSMSGRRTAQGRSFAQFSQVLDARKKSLAFFSEGQAATVVVSRNRNTRALSLNGLGQGGRHELPPHHLYESLMVALVPMAHVEKADRALVVGLGAGVTVDALAKLGAKQIEVVELERDVLEALSYIFPEDENPLAHPDVHVQLGDARHTLLKASRRGGGDFDVITSMPAHPWVASSIFTKEFFELAKANLSETGVFSTWFGLESMDQEALDSLTRAFTHTFDNYVIYRLQQAGALYLVGSKAPLYVDIERFKALRAHALVGNTRSIKGDYHLARQVAASGRNGDGRATAGIVNTDDSAFVELRAPRTASTARDLSHILPHRYLKPEMLAPEGSRETAAVELVEWVLGTPKGRLGPALRPVDPTRLKRLVLGLAPQLSQSARSYLEGRLALLERRLRKARTLLETVEAPLADRAARFLPSTYPEGPQRVAALRRGPPEGDTWLRLLDAEERLSLPPGPPSFEDDRWGWLIWHGYNSTSTVSEAFRTRFATVGQELARSKSVPLLELATKLAAREGLIPATRRLESQLVRVRAQVGGRLLELGRKAAAAGDYERANHLLKRALAAGQADRRLFELMAICAMELRASPQTLADLRQQMLFAGLGESKTSYILGQARAGKLAAERLEEAAPEALMAPARESGAAGQPLPREP